MRLFTTSCRNAIGKGNAATRGGEKMLMFQRRKRRVEIKKLQKTCPEEGKGSLEKKSWRVSIERKKLKRIRNSELSSIKKKRFRQYPGYDNAMVHTEQTPTSPSSKTYKKKKTI